LRRRSQPARALVVVLAPAAATGLAFLLSLQDRPGSIAIFVVAVAIATSAGGLLGGLVAALLSYLSVTYWFLEPAHSFTVRRDSGIAAASFILAAGVISYLMQRERRAARHADDALTAREQALGTVAASHRLVARLSAAPTPAEVADVLLDESGAVLDSESGWVSVIGTAGGALELLAHRGLPETTEAALAELPLDASDPILHALRGGEPRWYGSPQELAALHPKLGSACADTGAAAMVVLPLQAGERAIGFVALRLRDRRPVLPSVRRLLASWARQGSEALVRARLYESELLARESSDDARKLAARLQRTSAHLSAAVDLAEVAEVVVGELSQALGAVAGWLSMLDEGGRTLELVAAHGYSTDFVARYRSIPLDSDLAVADVVRRGQAAWIERAREQPGYPELEEATEATRADALALVPLRSVGRTFGFVALRFTEGRTWSDAERALVEGLADQCAESLERARLYEREHQTALTLQHSVLPEQLPEIPAVRLSARYVPGGRTGHVGGDWYDVVELPEGGAAAVVGDVVGKGVQAASAMAQLRNALRVFALEGYKPSTVLSRVNRLARSTGFSFATLVYLVLDADAASCRFASAGHLPPLVVEEDGSAWFVEGGRSLPIGVADDTDYRQEGFAVPRGATILLYTDGLVERRNESLDEGLERLRTVAAQFAGGPEPMLETVIEEMVPGGKPADDVALLAVHRLAVSSRSLRLRVPADPAELRVVRERLRAWLASEGADREEAEEIVLATSEACANAIEHPRMPRKPFVEVEASAQNGVVSLLVRDFGRWRPAAAVRNRGRGLTIIEELVDHVERLESDSGTEVRFFRTVRHGHPR